MKKIRVCFICLGNICRSPMAEYILKDKIKKYNFTNIIVDSRGTSYEEQGSYMYPKALDTLDKHNIETGPHKATCIEKSDFKKFDYFICMEERHIKSLEKVFGSSGKIIKLQDYDIEDPWYTNNFEKVYEEINDGCEKLIKKINNN